MKNEVIYNIVDKLIKLGLAFLLSVIAARFLAKDDFGEFVYISIFLSSALVIIGGGVDTIYIKKISRRKMINLNLFLSYIIVRAMLSLILAFLIVVYFIFGTDYSGNIILISFVACSLFLFSIYEQSFVALLKNRMMLKVTLCYAFIFFIIKVCSMYFLGVYKWKILIDGIECLVLFSVTMWLLKDKFYKKISINKVSLNAYIIIRRSFPLWLNAVILVLYSRIDQFYIGNIGSYGDIADYGIAINLNAIALIIPTALMTVYFPKMVDAYNSNSKSYDLIVNNLIKFTVLYGFSWILSCFIIGEIAVTLIYGARYVHAASYLQIISLSSVFIILGQVFGQHMVICGKYWVSFKRSCIGISLTITIYVIFDGNLDVYKVAYITVLNAIVVNFILYLLLPETRDILHFIKSFIRK